ncbi:MAG: DUF4835 family protein [Bacteroidetes bacterium]|nr:DUF4835 family protein [Bacteroidota bacterium]MDA1119157.1 DUF4835 family protein [Bacteroidota bacterium]
MKIRLLLFIFTFGYLSSYSQELNCSVFVNAQRVETTERDVFQEMEVAFSQFLNNRKWTDDFYTQEERINCNLVLNIQDMPSVGIFDATVQIVSARPVFGTDYESVVFNFADRDWDFEYTESQPLQFDNNVFTNNITSLLAYYAYTIIGIDYDTFEKLGGDPYFQKAWNVVNVAQQSGRNGWDQFNSNRNRYWLAENLINIQMRPIREGLYDYHRLGLDIFDEKPDDARGIISTVIKQIQEVNRSRPNSILTISFMDAKSDEITQMFSDGNPTLRRDIYNTLTILDPGNTDKYQPLINN